MCSGMKQAATSQHQQSKFDLNSNKLIMGWSNDYPILRLRYNATETCLYSLDAGLNLTEWSLHKVQSAISKVTIDATFSDQKYFNLTIVQEELFITVGNSHIYNAQGKSVKQVDEKITCLSYDGMREFIGCESGELLVNKFAV